MRVRDVLGRKPESLITVSPGVRVKEAVQLLIAHNIGGLPVVAPDGTLVGFVAERDIVRIVHEDPDAIHHLPVTAIMREVPYCDAEDPLEAVMRRMTRERLRHLVVRDKGRVLGVISVGDIVKQRLDQLETETNVLRDYVAAQRAAR